MSRRAYLNFGNRAVALYVPSDLSDRVVRLLGLDESPAPEAVLGESILVAQDGASRFAVASARTRAVNLSLGDALNLALLEAHREIVDGFGPEAVVLHAAALRQGAGGRGILIPGESHSGKSTFAAWLIANGYNYLADDVSAFTSGGEIRALYRPLLLRPDVWDAVSRFAFADTSYALSDGRRLVQAPERAALSSEAVPCGLVVVLNFEAGTARQIERITPAHLATQLMAGNYSVPTLKDHGLSATLAFARKVPAIRISYGHLDQLGPIKPMLDRLLSGEPSEAEVAAAIADGNAAPASITTPRPGPAIPEATPRKGPTKLTIGMATYDDYDGVYFTIQAMRMYHPEVMDQVQFVVLDNNPQGPAAPELKGLERWIPNFRYVPYLERSGTAVRDFLFSEAEGTYVLCVDCHVLLEAGSLKRLIEYFDAHPDTSDLLQGPLLYDGLDTTSTHFDPVWRQGMWGTWGNDPRAKDPNEPPFEIPMQGLGLFACRRAAWLGFNPAFRGFGGEEGYIHEKFRQAGHRALCLPFLRWNHRFGRPFGTRYANTWEDRIRNYVVGHRELGLPLEPIIEHFEELIGKESFAKIYAQLEAEFGPLAPAKEPEPA